MLTERRDQQRGAAVDPDLTQATAGGLTGRAVLIGLGMALFIHGWAIYSTRVVRSSGVTAGFFSPALFVGMLFLVCGVNPILKTFGRRAALRPAEALTVCAMGLMGGAPIDSLFMFITIPYYLATPENQWARFLHPHMPSWIAPRDEGGAISLLFEGLPPGGQIPWGVWVLPLFWWLLLFFIVAFSAVCVGVILRKQWAESERLRYPVLEPAIEMAEDAGGASVWPAFARGRLFWTGAALSFCFLSWTTTTWFTPAIPPLPVTGKMFSFGRDLPPLFTYIDPFTFSFSYFANLEVLFSIWFFFLVFVVEFGIFNRLGYSIGGRGDRFGSYDAASSWQGLGAFCVFVIWGLWMARGRLKEVWRKAMDARYPVDDENEMVSYRTAVFGMVFGVLFMIVFLTNAGMDAKMAVPLTLMTYILYIGVAKITAESGLLYVESPMTAQDFSVYLVGAKNVSPSSLTTMAFSYPTWFGPLTATAHAAKLSDAVRKGGRRLFWAAGLAFVAVTLLSVIYPLELGYHRGAENFGHPFVCHGSHILPDTISKIKEPFDTDWNRIMFFGIGAAVMIVMMFFRYQFPWWPIHPVGFTINGTDLVRNFSLTIFLAWACKALILRIGGMAFYRRCRPFFMGLLVGHVCAITVAFIVDWVWFPGAGHSVHPWIE